MKRYLRLVVLGSAVAFALSVSSQDRIRIIEAEGGQPLEAATIFSKDGQILGLSDKNGEFNKIRPRDYPLRISYMGYDPVTLNRDDSSTVNMLPAAYLLDEVTVTPGAHPVQRIVCYMREYLSGMAGQDSLLYFNEHIADFYLVKGKVKGFKQKNSPRILKSRLYARVSNEEYRDSIFKPQYRDDMIAWEQVISLPQEQFDLAEKTGANATNGKVEGKYSTKEIFTVTPHTVIRSIDYLADTKNHSMSPWIFKMIGFTLDFNEMQAGWVYNRNDKEIFEVQDLISGTFNVKVVGRGKFIKKAFHTDQPVEMFASYEIYPLESEYLSVEEAKDMLKNPPATPMTVSKNAAPLPPEIRRIVDKLQK